MIYRLVVILGLVASALCVHYEDPNTGSGCGSDEKRIKIQGLTGDFCSPMCDQSKQPACPADVGPGVTAKPQCTLKSPTGDQYCALLCNPKSDDAQCGDNASCKPIQSLGLCTFDDESNLVPKFAMHELTPIVTELVENL